MTSVSRIRRAVSAGVVVPMLAAVAFAQSTGDPGTGSGAAPPSDANGANADSAGTYGPPTTSTTTTYAPIGLPQPGADINPGLPSSSRPSFDASRSSDNFDLGNNGGDGSAVHGAADASGAVGKASGMVPVLHHVQRGDTLWDLCAGYFNNPWLWPKIWSYNPQIQNPHWIYPGDEVRLRTDGGPGQGGAPASSSIVLGGRPGGGMQEGGGFISRHPLVSKDTVFLRDAGYIDDPKKEVLGELVGAEEEQMLLTEGNNVYVIMRPGVDVNVGDLLTVFRPIRTPKSVPGARQPPGEIIAFKGTVKVDQWNPTTRVARGQLIESLDIVERGDKVGAITRRFDVVPAKPNTSEVWARVLTSIYPYELIGQQQIAFIDRGSKDGLEVGNRLAIVRRGDAWRHSLETTTTMARTQVHLEVPEHVDIDVTPLDGKDSDFPEEVVGELRVLSTRDYSAVTLVTSTRYEIEAGDRAVARKGY
ncbi:MAG TPA: LysM peptidoglycan-binding domain-containing protein [Polyangiaceae bacterium]|jgi:hypothetical protein|nr:LysM peptidoglycan-binding domain-containing protein [Polyangiaceae bacterium]